MSIPTALSLLTRQWGLLHAVAAGPAVLADCSGAVGRVDHRCLSACRQTPYVAELTVPQSYRKRNIIIAVRPRVICDAGSSGLLLSLIFTRDSML